MTQPATDGRVTAADRARAAIETDTLSVRPPSGDGGSVVARSSPVKKVLVYAALLVFALIYIYPFLVQVATSFKTEAEATADPIGLTPSVFTVVAYELLFTRSDFPLWFVNSTIVTIAVTLGPLFFVPLAGPARSDGPIRLGILTCQIDGGTGKIISSRRELSCIFEDANGQPFERYAGEIRRFGLDIT